MTTNTEADQAFLDLCQEAQPVLDNLNINNVILPSNDLVLRQLHQLQKASLLMDIPCGSEAHVKRRQHELFQLSDYE
jgi:hypothetical protein